MKAARRRIVLAAAALAAGPLLGAQTPAERRALGILSPHPKPSPQEWAGGPYAAHLRKLGWTEASNLVVVRPMGAGAEAELNAKANELVDRHVDVIWAIGTEAAVAAARATRAIPIVFWGVPYPVEQGLIESYARPGGNLTGMAFFTGAEVATAVLDVLRQLAPDVRRVAAIRTLSAIGTLRGGQYQEPLQLIVAAAESLGFDFQPHHVARREEFDAVFAAIRDSGAQGLLCFGTTVTFRERRRIADFALRYRLPSAYTQAEFVEAGGLFSYGANTAATVQQSLNYVDRILRGASPADLPVERPSRFELTVNLRTAGTLGLAVPPSVMLRTDRVIE